jgi:alanine racemase
LDKSALLQTLRPVRATIDLGRLAANYRAIAEAVPVPLMPVVKADAYGHGAVHVAQRLAALGAPLVAVAYVEEAVALRGAGLSVPIVVLSGFTAGQMEAIVAQDLGPVVGSRATLDLVTGWRAGERPLSIHLKVDTGMTRLGLAPDDVLAAADAIRARGTAEIVGLMTHLATADEDVEATERQLDLFDAVHDRLAERGVRPRFVHAANSAGLAFHRPRYTLARPGLLLYGHAPRPLSPAIHVQPVMRLSAQLAAIKDVPAGTPVSYGGRWVARRPSRIGTVPIGYADGIPRTRAMAERGYAIVHGARLPVAGTICMDLMMLDLTDAPGAAVGDEVVLMGEDPTAWTIAEWSDGTAWESLTRVGSRVPRVYVEDGVIVAVEARYLKT